MKGPISATSHVSSSGLTMRKQNWPWYYQLPPNSLFFCSWWSPMEGRDRGSHNQDFQWRIGAWRLSRWLSSKESFCKAGDIGDAGLIPGSGRSPGRELNNLFQYSCWDNPMDRGAWWTTVHGIARSGTWLECALEPEAEGKISNSDDYSKFWYLVCLNFDF